MNEDALDFQNKWNTEYLESDGLLGKKAIFELQWGRAIRFDFAWGTKTTTITVNKSINRSSIVGTINFSLVGSIGTSGESLQKFISSEADNVMLVGNDGKLYVKPQPDPEFPHAVLVATNW